MPELPEVETTRRGLEPLLVERCVSAVDVRDGRLRWPVPEALARELPGARFTALGRRGKYLLFETSRGTVIAHLGMSGSFRVVSGNLPPGPHDHVDFALDNGLVLRLRDPRRFGSLHWTHDDPLTHALLASIGPEPLSDDFDGAYLYARAAGRRVAVKSFIMDAKVVAGVGNIYASESLFLAGIHPQRAAGRIARPRMERLVAAVRAVLGAAIGAGGTTLRDFTNEVGEPGYFTQMLRVYGRAGEACVRCGGVIAQRVTGQRSTFFCARCQR